MSDDTTLVRLAVLIALFVLLLPVLVMVFMLPFMGMWGGGHMWNGGMWNGTGASWMGLTMWVVLLVLLLGGGYLLFRALANPSDGGTDPALEELRLAYARGDLSDEEFEERRERLSRDE